jgi:hypothetical protein
MSRVICEFTVVRKHRQSKRNLIKQGYHNQILVSDQVLFIALAHLEDDSQNIYPTEDQYTVLDTTENIRGCLLLEKSGEKILAIE